MVQHNAATDESPDIKIGVVPEFLAPAIDMFGLTRPRGIIHDRGRQMRNPRDQLANIQILPFDKGV